MFSEFQRLLTWEGKGEPRRGTYRLFPSEQKVLPLAELVGSISIPSLGSSASLTGGQAVKPVNYRHHPPLPWGGIHPTPSQLTFPLLSLLTVYADRSMQSGWETGVWQSSEPLLGYPFLSTLILPAFLSPFLTSSNLALKPKGRPQMPAGSDRVQWGQ